MFLLTIEKFYEEKAYGYEKAMAKVVQSLTFLKKDDDRAPIKTLCIGQIESRLKSLESFNGKCLRKEIVNDISDDVPEERISDGIRDLAGVRVICVYVDYIPHIVTALRNAPGITVMKTKDYIHHPELKPNGYRAFHLEALVEVPDMEHGNLLVPVEVQIRTYVQHVWAMAEHALLYKPEEELPENVRKALFLILLLISGLLVEIDAGLIIARELARSNGENFDPKAYLETRLVNDLPEAANIPQDMMEKLLSTMTAEA